ncbi:MULTISPECIES: glycosyltransferase family 4 protein [unclassified Butyrivibrio]|uniref:glycosyltransferase family 4 protein n=1 Tax=unclassified Butyrivibrio TaxID=2639466 RepID=UPI00047DA12F|nr:MULTISPECIES: glycosyltransferase family 4 protein [unclassified Butyrivibrio]
MKKVLFVSSDSSCTSGAFRCMSKLCELLMTEGEYYPIVVLPKKGNGEEILKKAGIEYKIIRSFNWVERITDHISLLVLCRRIIKITLNFFAIMRLNEYVRKNDISLIHINTSGTYIGAKVAVANNIPFIWHIRECVDLDHNKRLFCKGSYNLINKANKIICVSKYVYNHFCNLLDSKKMTVIYDGIDVRDYYNERNKLFSDRIVKFLSIGNMNSNKGQEYVIEAAIELSRRTKDFHLLVVGDGKKKKMLKAMAANHKKYISFMDAREDVLELFKNSDVFIMSSKAEGFGRTTIEAMLGGCLLLGTDSGATPELVRDGETGFLYKYDNSYELSLLMEKVVEEREKLFDVVMSGQKEALDKYNAYIDMKNIVNEYNKLS